MKIRGLLLSALAFASGLALGVPTPPSPVLTLIDDLGSPIETTLTARLLSSVPEKGSTAELTGKVAFPQDWVGFVEIEGEDHGPIRYKAEDLRSQHGALVVPRKAILAFGKPGGSPFSITYLVVSDGTLVPWTRREVRARTTLKVPAGSGVLTATQKETGRYTHLFFLKPGTTVQVSPSFSQSSVALLRVLKLSNGRPVLGAVVREIATETGTSEGSRGRSFCRTDQTGLCLVSAAADRVASLIEAEGLVPLRSHVALEAGEPRLIETVTLNAGSRPTFQIAVDGEAGTGHSVSLRPSGALAASLAVDSSMERSGTSDERGEWRPGIVPPGSWIVRVQAQKGQPAFEKVVDLPPDTEPTVALALDRIRVTGAVTRGSKGVQGVSIIIGPQDLGEKFSSTERNAKEQEIVTDSEGEFEAFVWREGFYDIWAGPGTHRTFPVPKIGTRVLLRLAEHDLVCIVVDPDGKPIPGASVTYKRAEGEQSGTRFEKTDQAGKVSFPVTVGSDVTAHAESVGYRRSSKATLRVPEEGPVGPLTLRLERDEGLPGRFIGAMGVPISGAVVAAVSETGESIRTSDFTDGEGKFSVSRSGGRSFRLLLVGPKVPLTVHSVYDVGQKEEIVFSPAGSGSLDIQFANARGDPISSKTAILEYAGLILPPALVTRHLSLRGLASVSDARGSLLIPDLPTGDYSVIVSDVLAPSGTGPLRVGIYVGAGRNAVRVTLEEEVP